MNNNQSPYEKEYQINERKIKWNPSQWIRNYLDSIHEHKVKQKFTEKLDKIIDKGIQENIKLDFMQDQIREILNKHGVMLDMYIYYIAYAEQILCRVQRLEWEVDRVREYIIIRRKWENRGLDPNILNEIDKIVGLGVGKIHIP
jgi:hypothetical protein